MRSAVQSRRIVGRVALVLHLTVGLVGCEGGTGPASGLWLEAVTPITLTGTVGQAVDPAPTVLVTGEDGVPRAGVLVRFGPRDGSGSLEISAVETDADGRASVGTWTLGPRAGSQAILAWVGYARVYFTVDAQAGPPSSILPLRDGNMQIADAGTALAKPIVAWVSDGSFGNPVAGVAVTFTVVSGGGEITEASAVTDALGRAEARWTLGSTLGFQEVRVESGTGEAVFTAIALCPVSDAACQGDGSAALEGRLAFVSTRDGNQEIYAVNADGSDLLRLTTDAAEDMSPTWSPDGTEIAFASDRSGTSQVYTMGADGSQVTRRTWSPGGAWAPAWSPDGSSLVYVAVVDGDADVWTVALGAEESAAPLFTHAGTEAQPTVSPDGTRLAIAADWDSWEPFHIYLVDAAGGGEARVAAQAWDGIDYSGPAWSPDGARLSFAINFEDLRGDWTTYVCVAAADGSGLIPLRVADPFTATSWSPGSELIAFTAKGDGDLPRIAWVTADGTASGTIIEDGFSPAWRP